MYSTLPLLNVAHQSTEPTYRVRVVASKAGPFHSTPPRTPGHARIPAGVGSLSAFRIVVIGVLNAGLCVLRSTPAIIPSLPAMPTRRAPLLVVKSTGAELMSQS